MPLFGLETEYAVAVPGEIPDRAAAALASLAAGILPGIPAASSGLFLANGGRLYVDGGGHPEYATPEVRDPWQLARHARAGDRVMARLCRELSRTNRRYRKLRLFRANSDRLTGVVTWGSHENYECGGDPRGARTAPRQPGALLRRRRVPRRG